jgi:DNA helicase-2/ATP-dependent DNA helicase PcrA
MDYETSFPGSGGLREFMEYLDYLDRQGAEFQEREPDVTEDSVKILTAHRAKGLQWPVVFIPACNKQRFPAPFRGDWLAPLLRPDSDPKDEHLAEERRVFYVAMTRAEQELHMTHSLVVGSRERARSPFIDEVADAGVGLLELVETAELQATETDEDRLEDEQYAIIHGAITEVAADADELGERMRRILGAVGRTWRSRMEPELIQGAFDNLGVAIPAGVLDAEPEAASAPERRHLRLSASALKTYATCPRKYQFQYVMRIPQKMNANAVAGSNVHRALEFFHKRHKADWRTQPIETLLAIHDEVLAESRFASAAEAEQWRVLDERILRDYLETERDARGEPTHFEASYQLDMPEADAEFYGFIDRMDEHADGTIEIIDYKTGAIQKEQGTVANDWQLPLYVLGMEAKGRTIRAATLYGMKDSADGSGPIQRVRIPRLAEGNDKNEFTDAVMDGFKQRVVEAVEGMRSGNYPEKVDARECSFCDYRLLCPAWQDEK